MSDFALLIPIFSVVGSFTMVVMIVWLISRAKQRQARYRAEVQTKLIEKFNSAPELADFLASPAGKQFVGGMHEPIRASVHDRIFSGIKWSLIITFIGVGFLIARFGTNDADLIVPAGILIALGIGWMIATFVTYRLSRSWGLIKESSTDLPSTTA